MNYGKQLRVYKHQTQRQLMETEMLSAVLNQIVNSQIELYEQAGLAAKANGLRRDLIFEIARKNSLEIVRISYHVRGGSGEHDVHGKKYSNFYVCKIKDYTDDVPAEILIKMAKIEDKSKLLILYNCRKPDPILLYQLPVTPTRDDYTYLCVKLVEWD